MTPWLSIVGIGEDGLDGVAPPGRLLIDQAETLVGGARHLAMAPETHPAERLQWSSPLDKIIAEILARRGRRVCVLATGNPLWYGIATTLAGVVDAAEMTIVPAPSAFSLACARLAWPLDETACFTLHGRPLDLLRLHLSPGARLVMLTTDGDSPGQIARLLSDAGYGKSTITLLDHMGGADERRTTGTAEDWDAPATSELNIAALNTIAVVCRAGADAVIRSRAPGLPDDAYENDGQLTKRETRSVTLAALMPLPGQRLWDVGAGCGSIAIEWLRAARGGKAIAIERNPARCAMIARNAAALGTPGLDIVNQAAPDALAGLAAPDAVFIGGGASQGLIKTCWDSLPTGGRIVANAVTIEGEAALSEARTAYGGDLSRIAITRAEPLGSLSGWRSLAPVTQWAAVK
jgi:precorrin-6Y C5,15-methyltransferase (decarboxylating)